MVWNNLDGLKRTRESLSRQTCADWEWLVIDGGSTDGSPEFARTWDDPRVTVVSERDKGIYDAMNKGLARATGEYVILLNSGDRLATTTALAEAKEVLVKDRPGILFCSSLMSFGVMQVKRKVKDPSYLWHGQPGLHQATIFDRREHAKFPYDMTYTICADYDVVTRMSRTLKLQSADILFSENEFTAEATSGRNKTKLILQAARAQRRNLKMGLPRVAFSVLRRIASSMAAKVITGADRVKRMNE
ncbi:glycosyltransferase [Granulicella rosea]|uniref:glycosyltransferase n=1 Tax=Granulicella rosea TaxID=474952 RepID=UPI0015958AE5|nr:glycosyltransferase [Granulicella rosea]